MTFPEIRAAVAAACYGHRPEVNRLCAVLARWQRFKHCLACGRALSSARNKTGYCNIHWRRH